MTPRPSSESFSDNQEFMRQLSTPNRIGFEQSRCEFGEFLMGKVFDSCLEFLQGNQACAATPDKILYTIIRTIHTNTTFE